VVQRLAAVALVFAAAACGPEYDGCTDLCQGGAYNGKQWLCDGGVCGPGGAEAVLYFQCLCTAPDGTARSFQVVDPPTSTACSAAIVEWTAFRNASCP
jgi:hypothetical protein